MKIEIDLSNPPSNDVLQAAAELLLKAAGKVYIRNASGPVLCSEPVELHPHLVEAIAPAGGASETPKPEAAPAPTASENAESVPPAPSATPAEPAALDLDINGLPWDARIHSAGRTKNADGSWRNKRGVDKAEREAIEAELKGLQASEASPEVFGKTPSPSMFDAPKPEAAPAPAPAAPIAAAPAPAPAAPIAAVSPATDGQPLTFASIMRRAAAEKKTAAELEAAYAAVGVKNAPGLAAKPELFESFAAALFGG